MNDEKSISDIIDDLVEVWHMCPADSVPSLEQFLAMSEAEYAAWATNPSRVVPRHQQYLRWLRARLVNGVGKSDRITELENQVADLQTKLTAARRQAQVGIVAKQEAEHGRWAI
jgi:polyhydroxyalkanoate synthesis regulator phasin